MAPTKTTTCMADFPVFPFRTEGHQNCRYAKLLDLKSVSAAHVEAFRFHQTLLLKVSDPYLIISKSSQAKKKPIIQIA